MVRITLPDGKALEFPGPVSPLQVAEAISPGLARVAVAGETAGDTVVDLRTPLAADTTLRLLTKEDPRALHVLRHSAAHLLANAVQNLFPGAKLGFGPATAEGFFYDFQVDRPFTEDDLRRIEAEMQRLAKEDAAIEREEVPFGAAIERLESAGERLKAEHLQSLLDKARASGGAIAFDAEEEAAPASTGEGQAALADPTKDLTITIYKQNGFWDLCRGPHLRSTGDLKNVKLLATSGAYWKGSEKNPMLQRIYGTAFFKKQELEDYLHMLEEAKKRDHRKLGQELDLFIFPEIAGGGMPFYKPKGALLRQTLMDWWYRAHVARGYDLVATPHLFRSTLWETSGHLENYGENMYVFEHKADGAQYGVKPMNCPGHILIFRDNLNSYRDLPKRLFEFGTVYRYERSGVLHGLMRVRALTQDDSHIFCTADQLKDEIIGVMDFVDFLYGTMEFPYTAKLATKPAKAVESDTWDMATEILKDALETRGLPYEWDHGGGAFYGPKIDFFMRDAIGRVWQGATIQCDFNLPRRFDLTYIGADNAKHQPIMVHRAILGSVERFLGVYIEHVAGAFPAWLAPEQVRVLNITDDQRDYAAQVAAELVRHGIRAEADLRNEKVGFKIREGELQKVPYLLIVGNKEKEAGTVAVRKRHEGDLGPRGLEAFIAEVGPEFVPPRIDTPVATAPT
ncbi:MAG TPA: threonine--tRNA ligase [bacterium]|nr:threonine--tRNA ligase [bacterium]